MSLHKEMPSQRLRPRIPDWLSPPTDFRSSTDTDTCAEPLYGLWGSNISPTSRIYGIVSEYTVCCGQAY